MKNHNHLLDAVSELDGELLEQHFQAKEALRGQKAPVAKRPFVKWCALAASFALVVVVAAVVLATVGVINTHADERETYLPDDRSYWFVRPQAPYVDHNIVDSLEFGMEAHEVFALIGKPNRYAYYYNYSYLIWELDDGTQLCIDFNTNFRSGINENGEYYELSYDYMFVRYVHVFPAGFDLDPHEFWNDHEGFESFWKNTDETVANPETE